MATLVDSELRAPDVLLGLLVLGRPAEETRFDGISRNIHRLVHELRADYPDLLGAFSFTETTPFPYSDRLDTALGQLQWARLVGMENPDFRLYFVKPGADAAFEDAVAPKLDAPRRDRLAAASRRFWERLRPGG